MHIWAGFGGRSKELKVAPAQIDDECCFSALLCTREGFTGTDKQSAERTSTALARVLTSHSYRAVSTDGQRWSLKSEGEKSKQLKRAAASHVISCARDQGRVSTSPR